METGMLCRNVDLPLSYIHPSIIGEKGRGKQKREGGEGEASAKMQFVAVFATHVLMKVAEFQFR